MRDRSTIHHEIERAHGDLEASLSELQQAVRHEVDPAVNVERAIQFTQKKLESVLGQIWAEFVALVRELRHTAEHEGFRAALREIFQMLAAAIRDLRAPA